MKSILKFAAGILLIVINGNVFSQVSGIKAIPGDYTTITAAITDINTVGLSGPAVLELQAGYSSAGEVFPITIGSLPGSNAINTLTIRPATGAVGIAISNALSGSTIDLINASNIIIDGRPGGTGSAKELSIQNHLSVNPAFRFATGSNNNLLRYCRIQAANTASGVIFFDTSGSTLTGNRFNTIANCIISDDGAGVPTNGIYSRGTITSPNSDNNFSNNEILNFSSSGIFIAATGNGGNWSIKGNSFYNNLSTPPSTPQIAINFRPGLSANGNTIEGNFIGGQSAQAGGNKWTNAGAVEFTGIYLNCGRVSGTALHNNTIRNISLSSAGVTRFTGISMPGGLIFNNGNSIGSATEANSIMVSGVSTITGIFITSFSPVSITDDFMGNITVAGERSTITGIRYQGENAVTITGNTIHHLLANTSGSVDFTGVYMAAGSTTSSLLHNNIVQNISLSSGGVTRFTGISIPSGLIYNSGNVIGSATSLNSITVSGNSATATGVLINSSDGVSVSDDIIGNITATATGDEKVYGVFYEGNGTTSITGNSIHHLAASLTKGIFINSSAGTSVVTLLKNTVTGIGGTGVGIENKVMGTASLNLTATGNIVSNWGKGFFISKDPGAVLQQSLHDNSISGNQFGFDNQSGVQQNATCNWWGAASGPSGAGSGTGDAVSPNVVFSPWATIPTFVAVNAGADQTIYIGYGPQTKTLTATATACGSTRYLWSTGSAASSIIVNPTVTTTYSVTVTDAARRSVSDEVTVFVQDIRCGNDKVFICHNGTSLCVNVYAVQAHLSHGDVLGSCLTNTVVAAKPRDREIENKLFLQVNPNPVYSKAILHYGIPERSYITVQLMDGLGREVVQLVHATQNAGSYQVELNAAGILPGLYFCLLTTRPEGGSKENRVSKKIMLVK